MALFKVFKLPNHKRFQYVPQYYDAQKEDLDKRIEGAKRMQGDDPEAMKERISRGLRRGMGDPELRRKSVLRSNLLVLSLIICLTLVFGVFIYFYFPGFIDSL